LPLKTSYDIVTQVIATAIFPFAVPPCVLIIMITFVVIALILVMSFWNLQGKIFVWLKENLFYPLLYIMYNGKITQYSPRAIECSLYPKAVPHSLINGFFCLLLNNSSWFHLRWKIFKISLTFLVLASISWVVGFSLLWLEKSSESRLRNMEIYVRSSMIFKLMCLQ